MADGFRDVLEVGLALIEATTSVGKGEKLAALDTLDTALTLVADHKSDIGAAVDLKPGLDDSTSLVGQLRALFVQLP